MTQDVRPIIVLAGAALVILLSAASAFSCSCGVAPPCQSFGSTAAVFIGTPFEMKQTTAKLTSGDEYPQRLFIFRVEESFRGSNTAQIEVRTGMGGGDCGYDFKLGDRYLVYAGFNAASGLYITGICSRTRPVADASEDLDYIRGLNEREPGATISGELRRYRRNLETEDTQQLGPLANIKVSATSDGKSFTTRTDERGHYQLTKLEPGQYVVKAELPGELGTYDSERRTTLNDRGCSVIGFQVLDNGSISGRVLDSDGKAVPKITLSLIPVSQAASTKPNSMYASADDEGLYEMKFVPPGNYLLGIRLNALTGPESVEAAYPRFYYAGAVTSAEATVITLGEGTVLKDVNLRLPPRLAKRVISGKVVFPDGSPAAKASVAHFETTYAAVGSGYGVSADEQGNFSFEGYEGISYYVRAHVYDSSGKQRHAEPVAVPTHGVATDLVLVISEPDGTCARCRSVLYGQKQSSRP